MMGAMIPTFAKFVLVEAKKVLTRSLESPYIKGGEMVGTLQYVSSM